MVSSVLSYSCRILIEVRSALPLLTEILHPYLKMNLERLGLEDQLAGASAVSTTARIQLDRVRLFLEENLESLTPSLSR